ncbi:MAG: hypothetical protein KDD19_16225 [Phaeodactylibacter sp.]|nr:hypothetical protein [Phaeodactylibacter sp.]MCB9048054.1 hypothetical protein [Lewinellaceae bacterium]
MKNCHIIATMMALLFATLQSCEKGQVSTLTDSTEEISLRDNPDYTDEELDDIRRTIDEIEAFKTKLDGWRTGVDAGVAINSREAVEQVEVAWNYYISKPGIAFANYKLVVDSIIVDNGSAIWTGGITADVFNKIQDKLSGYFDAIPQDDKAYQFIDLGEPVVDRMQTKVYLMANIGYTTIRQPLPHPQGIRWAGAPLGWTNPVPCSGAANEAIGQAVNANLGFFLQNLPPAPINPSNPNVNPNVVILSPISHVQTNLFGASFPLFNSPSPLFTVASFGNPALTNPVNAGNQPTNYLATGQYKIHADISLAPALPDENCFSFGKFGAYVLSNRQVGDSYTNQVNQILNTNFFNRRRLVSTYVGAKISLSDNPLTPQFEDVYNQEHPTYHFYARVLRILVPVPFPVHPAVL